MFFLIILGKEWGEICLKDGINNNLIMNKIPNIQTKKRLLESALLEYSKNGYFNTNVDSITKNAGISHGTFYLYFNNKNDVLIDLIHNLMKEISVFLKNKKTQSEWLNSDNLNDFEQPIIYIIRTINNPPGLLTAFIQGMVQNREIFDLFGIIHQNIANLFTLKIESLQKKGQYKGCNANIISQIMATALLMSIFIYSMNIIKSSSEILAKNISYIFFAGLNFKEKRIKSINQNDQTDVNKRINKTRRDLLKVAKQEFADYGYFDTKVANIAKKAGYSRGTFYQHFTDKDDIIQAIFQGMFNNQNTADTISSEIIKNLDTSYFDDVVRINSIVINIFEKYSSVNWALLQGAFYSKKIGKNYRLMFTQFSQPIIKKIDELKEKGKCKGVDSLIASQIILTTVSYSSFLHNTGLIKCPKHEFAVNMGKFLYYFLNFIPSSHIS